MEFYITARDNQLSNNTYSFYLRVSSNNNTIKNNVFEGNHSYGIRFDSSSDCTIFNNTIKFNQIGILINSASNNN